MRTIHFLSIAVLATFISSTAYSQRPSQIPLWVEGAPGSVDRKNEAEKEDIGPGKCNVTNIHNPSITPYLVTEKPPRAAILICPGGGHRMLCLGHEGYDLGQWFADHGIAAFVLKNRLARDAGSTYTVDEHAMADTRRALRMIRSKASEWNIDPTKLGVLGFSAGGELAALGAKDRDDISKGMAQLYLKYKEADVPAELHVYSNAGHGFGYRPGSKGAAGDWPLRLREWMVDSGLMPKE